MKQKWIIFFFIISFFLSTSFYIYAVAEKSDASSEYIQKYYKKALEAYKKRKYSESLDFIRHVIKSDMENYNLRYLASHNHWRLGNFEPAVIHMKKCIDIDSSNLNAYIDLALLYIKYNKISEAQIWLRKGIEVSEKNGKEIPAKLYNVLSRTYLYQGKPYHALTQAENAKAAFKKNKAGIKDQLEAIMLEARAHLALKNFEKAEIAVLWGLSLKKNNPIAMNLAGVIYLEWAKSSQDKSYAKTAEKYFKMAASQPGIAEAFKKIINHNLEETVEFASE